MEKSIDEFLGECQHILDQAAIAEGEAMRAEKAEKAIFSLLVTSMDGPVSKAEHAARCHERFLAVSEEATNARIACGLAKAKAELARMRWETWRTRAANRRAEMNLK